MQTLVINSYHISGFMDLFPSDRLTRFYSEESPSVLFERIGQALEEYLVPYKVN